MFRLITLILLTLLLVACNFPVLTSTPTLDTADLPTGVEITAPASGGGDCAWVWNSEPLPELSIQLQSAMEQAGLGDAAGRAIAFGEDCISADTGEVSYFAVKQTDFRFSLPVKDLTDLDALGELVEGVLGVIEKFPPDDTPGPMPGQVFITFVTGDSERGFTFMFNEASTALADGHSGVGLLEALGYLP